MSAGDDADARRAKAVEVAANAAPRYGISPDAFRDSVESVEETVERYARARHVIESERDVPVLEKCSTCGGNGSHACTVCDGSLRAPCDECEGSGRVPGVRGMKNCPRCRGNGDRKCVACDRGTMFCLPCAGRGSVSAGTKAETSRRTVVLVHPRDGSAVRRHVGIEMPADFDVEPSRWPARLEKSEKPKATELPPELRPQLAPRERIVSCYVQRFASSTYRVTYRAALRTGHVLVEEPWRAASGDEQPLHTRGLLSLGAAAVMAVIAFVAIIAFYRRHEWYVSEGVGWPLWLFAVGAAVAAPRAARGLLLARRAWTARRTWLPVAAYGVLVVGMVVAFAVPTPSIATAEAALASGDLVRAEAEAAALADLGIDTALADRVRDQIQLRHVRESQDAAAAATWLRQPWRTASTRRAATREVRERLSHEIRTRVRSGDGEGLAMLAGTIADVAPDLSQAAEREAAVARLASCTRQGSFECAESSLREATRLRVPHARLEPARTQLGTRMQEILTRDDAVARSSDAAAAVVLLRPMAETAERYERIFDRPATPTKVSLDERVRRAEADVAASERRAAQARAVAARRDRREQARNDRAFAPLLCRDGTYSPSCTCGGSRRGCCSHHGGVAGCSE
ncbi:MAG: hypothetical protein IT379_39290 [Deltaproteobacteria bacterium]|nr:hypothetical protein [Deltaproteobacteria bacterium]